MESRWSDAEAASFVARYGDVGERVYTTRLLGQDPRLVVHGGGNSSSKGVVTDLLGEQVEVLRVKGSGWDMGAIEPAGLPAVRLAPLRRARRLAAMSDEDMVAFLRGNLLDPYAPNPSVETLLHAFLPHRYVDHTHASAVLAVTDQPDPVALAHEIWGERVAVVPYVMPGFDLAKRAAEIADAHPGVEGLVLLKHGLFSFGETAREAYERHVSLVTAAEERLARGRRPLRQAPTQAPRLEELAPALRGACGGLILDFRTSELIRAFVGGAEVDRYATRGVVTPDHVLRTKMRPMILRGDPREAVAAYVEDYRACFARHATGQRMLDPTPRVVLVPGLGLFGLGNTAKDAAIAADVAEVMVATVTDAEAIGTYTPVSERDTFDVEYWSLEQAKLGKAVSRPRRVVVVTGGASGIGAATAAAFRQDGAEVAVLDREGGDGVIACDVTRPDDVRGAFDAVVARYGGVDVVVSNAGAAWSGVIGEVDDATLRASFELNFFAHQRVAAEAVRVMRAQGRGGCLLFNVSKQAVNPGKAFGPYGLPKAALLALVKQYALDHGRDGIRACGVNADRVRTGLLTDEMIAARAGARGVSEAAYMGGNLLGREVAAEDVAQAFVFLASAPSTTAAILTVDGGNIEASLR